MRLKEEAMQARREAMIQTAFQLFCERGIEAVSMREIAKKAHVADNTIYRYFDNKETLVLETFVKLWNNIMQRVDRSAEGVPNYNELSGYEQIQIWLDAFRCLYETNQDFIIFSYEAKLYLLRHNVRLDNPQQDNLMHSFRGSCIAALDKGKADGSIPVNEDSTDLFYALWGAIRGYIVKIVIYERLFGKDSPWEARYDTLKQGMLSALRSGWKPAEV